MQCSNSSTNITKQAVSWALCHTVRQVAKGAAAGFPGERRK